MKKATLVLVLNEFMTANKLKIKLLVFLLSVLSLGAFANPRLASKEQIGMFKNSTTCVVLDNGGLLYNVLLKDAVEKYWKSTQFEFIDEKEFENRRFDSKYSFLVLMKGAFDKDPGGVTYDYLSLVLGGSERTLTDMPEICSIPISYSSVNSDNYGYVLPAVIKFMQKHARNLEDKRFFILLNGLKYYNGTGSFKDNVLLLDKNMMASDANTESKIRNVYPYSVKLLDTKEFQDELNSNPINTMFVFHVGPNQQSGSGKCFEMIFDIEGNLYYYNYRNITNDNEDGFNLNDFKHLR
jgi:hypothetical protein